MKKRAKHFVKCSSVSGVLFTVLFIYSFIDGVTGDGCERRFIILSIQRPGCMPRKIMASACRGECTSYSRPSTENPQSLEYFCQCCDSNENVFRRAVVACPNIEWSPGQPMYRRIHVQMNLPRTCGCRPCSQTPQNIVPAEGEFWTNTGKRAVRENLRNMYSMHSNTTESNSFSVPFIHIDNPDLQYTVQYL